MRLQLRNVVLFFIAVMLAPFVWVAINNGSDMRAAEELEKELAGLRDRLRQAESLSIEKENNVQSLQEQMKILVGLHRQAASNFTTSPISVSDTTPDLSTEPLVSSAHVTTPTESSTESTTPEPTVGSEALVQETRDLLGNMSLVKGDITLPGLHHYLPQMVGKPTAIQPAIKVSQGRVGVSVVMGVPTIKREVEGYLLQTLHSLVDNLSEEERLDTLIVVLIAEPWDLEATKKIVDEIETNMAASIESGLVEILAPPADFYPDMDNLRLTLGDTAERVRWRTKQNLDFSYLMLYARTRGTYYVQLEDDVVTKPGYLTTMKNFAHNQKSNDWVLLEFSYLGFIGKMFRSRDLPMIAEFFIMFHNDKPVDWLLDHLLYVKVCNPEKDTKHCRHSMSELRRRFKPSLFQHVGTHSSLKGKVQKLKDKDFGKGQLLRRHPNPTAEVSTTLKVYQRYTLLRAYVGESYFWGLLPQPQDMVLFKFTPPVNLEKYLIRSGSGDHPSDKFYNTTLEILPSAEGELSSDAYIKYKLTTDGFYVVNHFDRDTGLVEGQLPSNIGLIDSVRLHVHEESDCWVIISEILFQVRS